MTKIILQPAGDGDARKHFIDTIEHPVSIDRISNFIDKDILGKLYNLFPKGK